MYMYQLLLISNYLGTFCKMHNIYRYTLTYAILTFLIHYSEGVYFVYRCQSHSFPVDALMLIVQENKIIVKSQNGARPLLLT